MFLRLLLLLSLIPLIEVYLLLKLGQNIGWAETFFLVVVTGFIGAWLLRYQGLSVFKEVQQKLGQNKMPTDAIAKGFLIFVGGLLLLTPGVFTDLLGLSLVFPPTQILWRKYFNNRWQSGLRSGQIRVYSPGYPSNPPPPSASDDIIDVEPIDPNPPRELRK